MANNKDFKVKNGIKPTSYHEGLGTVTSGSVTNGYDLSVAAYDSKSFSVGSQATAPRNLQLISSGTKMYTMSGGTVYQYTLSTAYDVSTAAYDSKSFSTTSQDSSPIGFGMKPDGTKLYMIGYNSDTVYQYTLSTAYDISTASYDSKSFNVGSQAPVAVAVSFKTDGTKMFVAGNSNDAIYQYTLSTAWDVSTASYDSVSLDISAEQADVSGMQFSSDGTVIFIVSSADIDKYTLSTAWDISTATASSLFSTSSQDTTLRGVAFNADGTKTYVAGDDNNTIYQYSTGSTTTTNTLDLSTGSVFEITPTSDIQVGLSNPAASGTVSQATLLLDGAVNGYDLSGAAYDSKTLSISSQEGRARGVAISSDGTNMYIVGSDNDTIYQYSLTTAYDVSTGSYASKSFSVSSQATVPQQPTFNSDGTKMWIIDAGNDAIFQYSLSTAWDISTASYDSKSLSVSSQATSPTGFAFNGDGTVVVVMGQATNNFYQYSLTTAYDISTASYDSVSESVTSSVRNFTFNDDGTKLFAIQASTNNDLLEYTLSTAYDVTTKSLSTTFLLGSQDTQMYGLAFSADGSKLYISGYTNDNIYQYTTGLAYTVTYDSTLQWGGGTAPDSPLANETDVLTFSTRDGGTTYQAAIAIDGAA
jgi:sugar lactone lactonase YvrE